MQLDSLSSFAQKVVILLLNFVDDIAILALTRLGVCWVWLEWLSTILMICTLVYWTLRLWRYYCRQYTQSHV